MLITDLANPTSNAIYRRIGYAPSIEVREYRFVGPDPGSPEGADGVKREQ